MNIRVTLSSSLFMFLALACSDNVSIGGKGSDITDRGDGTLPADSGSDASDPCANANLPICAPACNGTFGSICGKPCSAGDECIFSDVGDNASCVNGSWQCQVHPPLGLGCNLACRGSSPNDAGSNDAAPSDAGSNDAAVDSSDANDPCATVTLPACAAQCTGTFGDVCGKPCTAGDKCIFSRVGDQAACANGTWQCEVHPPLGPGCNLVCR